MAWCMQRIRIRRGCCRGRLTTRRNSLRVHMADIVWIRASLEPTLDDKGWRKSIDLVGLSVCIRVLSSNVSHQRLSARVHIFRIVLLENLLVHQSRIPCLLSKRRREERHLHRQQSGHKHRSYDRHTRSRIRHLRWQQQPVDEHMSRTEQTKHPDTNRQWIPNSQLPNIAFCIGVSSRVCGARNRIRKVSQRGRGHWGRIDANSLGTGSRRSLVNGRLEHAIMALAIEGVKSIKCGKTDQEMDNKRRLKKSPRLASTQDSFCAREEIAICKNIQTNSAREHLHRRQKRHPRPCCCWTCCLPSRSGTPDSTPPQPKTPSPSQTDPSHSRRPLPTATVENPTDSRGT